MLIMLTGNSVPVLLFPNTLGIPKQTEQVGTLSRTSLYTQTCQVCACVHLCAE